MKYLVVFLMILAGLKAGAQIHDPVKWSTAVKKVRAGTYEVHLLAEVAAGWHIYARHQPKDAIAAPTVIKFSANPVVKLVGVPKELGKKMTQKLEPPMDISQYYYAHKVDFVQVIKLVKNDVKTKVKGTVSFMACTDEMCLPEKTVPFEVEIK